MAPERLEGDLIVNFPLFDVHYTDESDFYVYSGYVKLGDNCLMR